MALTQVPLSLAQDEEEVDATALFSAGAMTGEQQDPPVESDGVGTAVCSLSADETELHYVVIVTGLEAITQAHVYAGQRGEDGEVVAFLFGQRDEDGEFTGAIEGGVTFEGVLATGTITEGDLLGPLEGESLQTLVDAMRGEEAYVNVHTVDHPGGEIRGQLLEVEDVEVQFDGRGDVWHDDGRMHVRPGSRMMIRENDEIVHHHDDHRGHRRRHDGERDNDRDRGPGHGPGDARGRGRDDHHRGRRDDDDEDDEE